MLRYLTRLVALVTLLVLAPSSAWAQSAQDQAAQLVEEGSSLFQAGDYGNAAEFFEEAYGLDPHPVILFNLARCYQELGELGLALTFFEEVTRIADTDAVRDAASTRILDVRASLEEQGYDPDAVTADNYVGRGAVIINSSPAGATLYFDDEFMGQTPVRIEQVDEGTHNVRLVAENYYNLLTTIEVTGGRTNERSYTLQERTSLDEYVPPQPGYLTILAPVDGAEILLDGEPYSITPLEGAGLAPGSYSLQVRNSGWISYNTTVDIESGQETIIRADITPIGGFEFSNQSRRQSRMGTVLIVGGGVLVATGTTFGILALGNSNDYNDNPSDPDRGDYRDAARTQALVADLAIGTGAALALTGIILKIVSGGEDDFDDLGRDQLVIAPGVGPRGSIGVAVDARW